MSDIRCRTALLLGAAALLLTAFAEPETAPTSQPEAPALKVKPPEERLTREAPPVAPPDKPATPDRNASWIVRPSGEALGAEFPEKARRNDVSGQVKLDCVAGVDTRVRCEVASETPTGYGFGEVARRVVTRARMTPAIRNGVLVETRIIIPVSFRLSEAPPPVRMKDGARQTIPTAPAVKSGPPAPPAAGAEKPKRPPPRPIDYAALRRDLAWGLLGAVIGGMAMIGLGMLALRGMPGKRRKA